MKEAKQFSAHGHSGIKMNQSRNMHTSLPSGISVSIDSFSVTESFRTDFEIESSPLVFGYQISGSTRSVFKDGGAIDSLEFTAGNNAIGFYPETRGVLEYLENSEHCSVSLFAPPEILLRYIESGACNVPVQIKNYINQKNSYPFMQRGQESPTKTMLLHRLLNRQELESFSSLFIESICLELIAVQLAEWEQSCRSKGACAQCSLSPSDVEKIYAARDTLVRSLEDPPGLIALAHSVGLNDFKLKRGFRAVFGTTVFGYFRDYRLDKARNYLEQGDLNVTEVAGMIGYSNLGHFSKAFYDRFGVKPSEYRLSKRRRISRS
ncbi:helix-turn-helix domain-containing protein [Maridesulfovibrio sp.]|uniref:helix-turn-helix domain-containing protein n=1 Tax=Maridesulfovibrio sp. TaxID=2795000 RepID=UPI003BA8C2AD